MHTECQYHKLKKKYEIIEILFSYNWYQLKYFNYRAKTLSYLDMRFLKLKVSINSPSYKSHLQKALLAYILDKLLIVKNTKSHNPVT